MVSVTAKMQSMSNIKDLDDTQHLEDATSEHSPVKVKAKEQDPDQINHQFHLLVTPLQAL